MVRLACMQRIRNAKVGSSTLLTGTRRNKGLASTRPFFVNDAQYARAARRRRERSERLSPSRRWSCVRRSFGAIASCHSKGTACH